MSIELSGKLIKTDKEGFLSDAYQRYLPRNRATRQ
jgi:hypothetical protein